MGSILKHLSLLTLIGILLLAGLVELLDTLMLADSGFSLRFQRDLIEQGEWWRLLSGHLDHLGWNHFILNAAFFAILYFLFEQVFVRSRLLVFWLFSALAISALILLFSPSMHWYVGLSGTLYSLLVVGLLCDHTYMLSLRLLVLCAVFVKIAFEQLKSDVPAIVDFIGGPVAVDAHLYGVFSGILLALLLKYFGRNKDDSQCSKKARHD